MSGKSKNGNTYGFGEGEHIQKIYLFDTGDFDSIEIRNVLYKFGEISEIKNSDIMESVLSLKDAVVSIR
jgi:hypothetical protein